MENVEKSFWIDSAKAGCVLGLVLTVLLVISWGLSLDIEAAWFKNILGFFAIVATIYIYGKRRSVLYGDAGFTYGQSISFIITIMLFAGFLYGITCFLMQNHIAPDYYKEAKDIALMEAGIDLDSEVAEFSMRLMKSLPFFIFLSILNMVIYGLFVGLLVSIFIKRPAKIFSDHEQ